jgi:hypothetical protein
MRDITEQSLAAEKTNGKCLSENNEIQNAKRRRQLKTTQPFFFPPPPIFRIGLTIQRRKPRS